MKKSLGLLLSFCLAGCTAQPADSTAVMQENTMPRGCLCHRTIMDFDYSQPLAAGEAVDEAYFEEVAFLGDSRAVELIDYHVFEKTHVLASTGLSINQWGLKKVIPSPDDPAQKVTLLEALDQIQVKACYLIVGLNELGWIYPEIFEQKLAVLIDQVREKQPDADLIIQMLYPISERGIAKMSDASMEQIGVYNEIFKKLAVEKQVYLLDPTEVVVDAAGQLDEQLTSDGVHLNQEGFQRWKGYVMTHTIRKELNAKMECIDPDGAVDHRLPEPGQTEREERGGSDGAAEPESGS